MPEAESAPTATARREALRDALAERILVLDGAWGTMLQREGLDEQAFRGERFRASTHDLRGDYDALTLTQPAIVRDLHARYLEAGAEITCTNTFGSTRIAQADYGLDAHVDELNRAGARLAREAAAAAEARDGRRRWVAGVLGPTNRSASLSPDVTDPAAQGATVATLRQAYHEAAGALIDGGVDLLLLETVFDTLNARAAIAAIEDCFDERGARWPLIISATIAGPSGRLLSGQSLEAWWIAVEHAHPLAVGLNCAPGATLMGPHLEELARAAAVPVSVHPNAGQPNEAGEYDLSPQAMAATTGAWAHAGLLNIAGSCCGSTPEHTRAIAEAVAGVPPRPVPSIAPTLRLAGLDPLVLPPATI